jgi:hypothetical protein
VIDEEGLNRARDRVRRLEQVRRLRATVAQQLADIDQQLVELREDHAMEQRDVDKLNGRTLTAILARIAGTRDERLATEQAEVDVARLRLAGHEDRYRRLRADLDGLERDLAGYADAPRAYEQALLDAEHGLRGTGDPRAAGLSRLTVRIADLTADLREYREARQAGEVALAAVEEVLRPLAAAHGWSTADLFSGSLADLPEHEHLTTAQDAAWYAQQALDTFTRELADLGVDVALQLPEVDNRWFVDVFFDNLLTDALRHRRIARTYDDTADVARWLRDCLIELDRDQARLAAERTALRAERERLLGLG